MFKLINTKILAGILAALLAIAGLMVRQHQVSERQAIAAEQAARLLKQQQDELQAQKTGTPRSGRRSRRTRERTPT